jgi:hypothetical protein
MTSTAAGKAKANEQSSPASEYRAGFTRLIDTGPKRVGYGLPCANCGTYYAADQSVCPICKCGERVAPNTVPQASAQPVTEAEPDETQLEEQRERFLMEYKAQMFAADTQIDPAASFGCSLEDNHSEIYEPASVCKGCYEAAQQRADRVEAALHMDLIEAAQVVHDAVWADPSDPSKTYQNAAHALLTELRKRAGIDLVFTTLQPYTH